MPAQDPQPEQELPSTAKAPKKAYEPPVLTVHGTVDEITLSGPGRRAEAGSGHSHP